MKSTADVRLAIMYACTGSPCCLAQSSEASRTAAAPSVKGVLFPAVNVALASQQSIIRALNEFHVAEERDREELSRELGRGDQPSTPFEITPGLERALIPLLVEKGIISESELRDKARELGVSE